jgi:hypothetical protein
MGSRRAWRDGEADEVEVGLGSPGRRATLRESEAEELRERLDALLAELGRSRRAEVADLIRRPAVIAAMAFAAAITVAALMSWRRSRR